MAQRFEIAHRHRWCAMAADDNALELWLDGCLAQAPRATAGASRGLYCPCSSLRLLVSCAGAALDVIAMLVRTNR